MKRIIGFCLGVLLLLFAWLTMLGCSGFGASLDNHAPIAMFFVLSLVMLAAGVAFVGMLVHIFGPIARKPVISAAAGTFIVALWTACASGPQIYHAHFGVKTEALIVAAELEKAPPPTTGGIPTATSYHLVEVGTNRDLGWMARGPRHRAHRGERIEVSLDPHHHTPPIATQRLGWTTVPSAILLTCFATLTLFAGYGVTLELRIGDNRDV